MMNSNGKKMINGLKLMKYSLAFKMNIVLMIAFTVLGLAYEVTTVFSQMGGDPSRGITNYNGIWMLAISPIYATQLMYGLSLSGVIQSSSAKKSLLVYSAVGYKAIAEIICFAILAVTRYLCCRFSGVYSGDILFGLVFFGLFSMILSLYTIIIYRNTTVGYVIMLPIIIACMLVPVFLNRKAVDFSPVLLMERLPFGESYAGSLAVGAAIVIVDIVLFYILSNLLYKVPLSEKAFRQLLSRSK